MPPEDRDPAYLWDMLDAARTIQSFTTGVALDEYLRDRKLQLAVERAIEILGEAARLISPALKAQHPEIPWPQIVAQRNVLAARGSTSPSATRTEAAPASLLLASSSRRAFLCVLRAFRLARPAGKLLRPRLEPCSFGRFPKLLIECRQDDLLAD